MAGQRYVQRQDGAFFDVLSVQTSTDFNYGPSQIVALNASGYIDDSLLGNHFGAGVASLNGLTGMLVISGGQNVLVTASGQMILISASGGGGGVDLSSVPCSYVIGKPAAGQNVMDYTAETSQIFPANFSSPPSVGSCGTNPTATAVYTVFKNATNVGTITINTSGGFVFATTGGSPFSLNQNDRLTVVAPGSQDATLSDVSLTLVGSKTGIPTVAYPVFTWRGVYNGSTSYNPWDVVSYLGSSYVCIAVSTGNVPTNTSFWNLMAAVGTSFGVQSVNGATGNVFVVQTVNNLTGAVTISGGNNVSVTVVGQTVLISTSGGGGGGGGGGIYPTFTKPLAANFSFSNPNSYAVSATDKSDRLLIQIPASATGVALLPTAAFPSTPYTIDVGMVIHGINSILLCNMGLVSAGGAYRSYGYRNDSGTQGYFQDQSWSSVTSPGSQNTTSSSFFPMGVLLFIRITDDGTNRKIYWSMNGKDYELYLTQATNTGVTPTNAGLIFYNSSGFAINVSVYHWLISTSILPQFAA